MFRRCLVSAVSVIRRSIHSSTVPLNPLASNLLYKNNTHTLQESLKKATELQVPHSIHELNSSEESSIAQKWIDEFTSSHVIIPKDSYEIIQTRSSGPGGQNVNKVNTKVTLIFELGQRAQIFLPPYVIKELQNHTSYAKNRNSLVISSSETRSQRDNYKIALDTLKHRIIEAASKGLIGETTPEQKKRVKELEKQAKEKRMAEKKHRKQKKQDRKALL